LTQVEVRVVSKACLASFAVFCRLSAYYASDTAVEFAKALDLLKAGNLGEAERVLDRCLADPQPPAKALYWKAYVQFASGNYRNSALAVQKYAAEHPEDGQARKLFGLNLFMLGNAAESETELQRAAELIPNDEEVRYYLGRVYFSRQNMPAALETFTALLKLHPQSMRAHNQLGQTYEGMGQFEKAQEAYERAIALDQTAIKRSEWPHFNLGVLKQKGGNPAAALPHFDQALSIKPGFPEARLQRAVALASTDNQGQARKELEALTLEDPSYANAHYQLGRLYAKLGDPQKSKQHLLEFERLRKK
jgi:tetratricopeptide (TPR) repeat protein